MTDNYIEYIKHKVIVHTILGTDTEERIETNNLSEWCRETFRNNWKSARTMLSRGSCYKGYRIEK